MLRLLYFLLLMYLFYIVIRYLLKFFSIQQKLKNNRKRENREIIDIDYEEIQEEGKFDQKK